MATNKHGSLPIGIDIFGELLSPRSPRKRVKKTAGAVVRVRYLGEVHDIPLRDNQRSKIYKSENEALVREQIGDGSIEAVTKFVRRVEASKTWRDLRARFGVHTYPKLQIKDGRGTRSAYGSKYVLNLPVWARNPAVVLHEMAHTAAGSASAHHWPFAQAFLVLVGRFMGAECRNKLKAAFKKNRVRIRPKKKLSPERLEQLREQGRKLAAARHRDT